MKSVVTLLLIAFGGAIGALARYGITILNRPGFPYGTLAVNFVGCFIMGLLARWIEIGIARSELRLFLGIGFLGALTTFSTFSFDALRMFQTNNIGIGLCYILLTNIGCLALVVSGYLLARTVWG